MIKKPLDIILIGDKVKYDQVMVHHRLALSHVAALAIDLAKMSTLAPVPDNSIVTTEQHYRLPTEKELVDRCVTIAELMYEKLAEHGLIEPIPPFDEMRSDAADVGFKS